MLFGGTDYELTIDLVDYYQQIMSTTTIRAYLPEDATADLGAVIFVVQGTSAERRF